MNEYPTIDKLGLPVEYVAAGVAYVPWELLRSKVRQLQWEQMFIGAFGNREALVEGAYAHDVEEILERIANQQE